MVPELDNTEWEKIQSAPSKNYRIQGSDLIRMKDKIDELSAIHDEMNATIFSLEEKVTELEANNKNKDGQITAFKSRITNLNELISSLEKVVSTRDETMGAQMDIHTSFVEEIKRLTDQVKLTDKEISDLNDKVSELKSEITELKKQNSKLVSKKSKLEAQLSDWETQQSDWERKKLKLDKVISENEKEITGLKTKVSELQEEGKRNLEAIGERNEEINSLNLKILALNTKIQELEDQIPKKAVLEKADEVVKGRSCPNCGFTTFEEYKSVKGKKELIRKYCPNPNCRWIMVERPELSVELEGEVPENKTAIQIFEVKKDGMEEVTTLNSKMVAIIADPVQYIIWIWRGKDSDRFIYAEATREVTKVKNEIIKLPHARIERVEEGEEPENFSLPDLEVEK